MRRVLVIIFMTIVGVCSSNAQNKTTLVQRINEIKNQNDVYFWDQYTHPDADTAKVNATKRLLLDVNGNRNGHAELSVEEIMPYANYVTINRGNLKQYFVYIKKSDAAAIGNSTIQPAPVADMPVKVETATEPKTKVGKAFVPDAFVQRVMETKNFTNVYRLLKSMQSQGQILQFGRLKDVEDYSSLDLILFDMQSQEIITMLSPVTASGNRINVVDGVEDSLDNYPTNMTAVIWYIRQ